MGNQGWIKLHRQIQNCFLWEEKPFDKCRAWIDLLILANHEDKRIMFNGYPITVIRGQYLTSIRKLADRWGWSYDKVCRFLNLLVSEEMIVKESNNNRTLISLVNYEIYQSDRTQTSEQTEHSPNADRTQTSEQTSDKQEYKELKNRKNEKNNKYKAAELLNSLLDSKNISEPLADKLREWVSYKCERKEGYTETGMKSLVNQMEKKEQEYGSSALIECIETCMSRQYKGIIEELINKNNQPSQNEYLERWKNA